MISDGVPRQLQFLHAPLIWPMTTPPHVPFNKIFFLIYSDCCPKPLLPNQVLQLILHHNDQCKNGLVTQGKPIQSLQKTSLQDRWPRADWVAMLGVCESGAVSACDCCPNRKTDLKTECKCRGLAIPNTTSYKFHEPNPYFVLSQGDFSICGLQQNKSRLKRDIVLEKMRK